MYNLTKIKNLNQKKQVKQKQLKQLKIKTNQYSKIVL